MNNDNLTWSLEIMRKINALTPAIEGKAFDPGWAALRNDLEEYERSHQRVLELLMLVENQQIATLLEALNCANAALNQNATFPADIALARRVIRDAIDKTR
jgi:hypothetical protein